MKPKHINFGKKSFNLLMITSVLQGGLGNQMFQMAAAWSLSKKIGSKCFFDLESSKIETQGNPSNKYKDNLFKNVTNLKISDFDYEIYTEPTFSYLDLPQKDNLTLKGYFQSEKYFYEYKSQIKNLFFIDDNKLVGTQKLVNENSGDRKTCSIHVRRGDYLQKPNFHPTCDMNYYKKAMSLINADKYYIVSDDLSWCKENFIGNEFVFSPFTDEINDLYLIMSCKNHIIANSSFSWWGAYLSGYNMVISPKLWFGIYGPRDTQDIYCHNWIKI